MRENRRWSSVNRTRRPFSCSLWTRFSSTRYSMTSCWWRLTHPARVTSSSRKGERSAVIGRSYRAAFGAVPGTGSAEYSDTTGSTKPASGYDKKTMAVDIHELTRSLKFDRVSIVGHDIGLMVAYAYAAQLPQTA